MIIGKLENWKEIRLPRERGIFLRILKNLVKSWEAAKRVRKIKTKKVGKLAGNPPQLL